MGGGFYITQAEYDQLRAEIERLRANQEQMWCAACGTVTRDGECDCTRFETGQQRLVNYVDQLHTWIEELYCAWLFEHR